MATSTFAINAHGQHDHATLPSHENPEPLPAIKPLSRSTSYSFYSNAGQQPRATARSDPSSPNDTVASSQYTFEESHALGRSMKGKTRARPRGESDLGKPSPLRPIPNGFTAFAPVPESPVTTSKTRYVMIFMACR
jgi:hypothetical protein